MNYVERGFPHSTQKVTHKKVVLAVTVRIRVQAPYACPRFQES